MLDSWKDERQCFLHYALLFSQSRLALGWFAAGLCSLRGRSPCGLVLVGFLERPFDGLLFAGFPLEGLPLEGLPLEAERLEP